MPKYLFKPSIVANGLLWLVAVAMQIGGWINHSVAYALLGIAFVWSVCTITYWVKRRKTGMILTEKGGERLEISRRCTETLSKLHERTLQLKDKAVGQYYRLFTPMDLCTLTNNLMNVVSKEEDKAVIAKVKKGAGKKKLSKKADKKHQQIEDLFDALRPVWDRERSLADFVAWSNEVDKLPNEQNPKYEGINKRREKDKRWRKLFNELNSIKLKFADIFADKDLEKMINDYLDYSYLGATLCLVTDLFEKYFPADYLPAEYVDSGAYRPYVEVQAAMTRLLEKITNKINELQSNPKG